MRHVFIINPKAGKQDQTARIYAMADALRTRHGLTCECLLTSGPGGGTELARRAAESGEEVRLYACGGDGTKVTLEDVEYVVVRQNDILAIVE